MKIVYTFLLIVLSLSTNLSLFSACRRNKRKSNSQLKKENQDLRNKLDEALLRYSSTSIEMGTVENTNNHYRPREDSTERLAIATEKMAEHHAQLATDSGHQLNILMTEYLRRQAIEKAEN